MVWHDRMYLGVRCRKTGRKLKYRISHGLLHPMVYLVTLPTGTGTVLEIVPSLQLLQPGYPKDDLVVVGMGATRSEALGIVTDLLSESYRLRGDLDVASYLCTSPR